MSIARKGRVLVLDDMQKWREEVVELLSLEGYHVEAVATAHEARELLNRGFYHILLLDIRLNEGDKSNEDGIELLASLSDNGLIDAFKVIMLSMYGTRERTRRTFKEYGVADFLFKDEIGDGLVVPQTVKQVLAEKMQINLQLKVRWPTGHNAQHFVHGLHIQGTAATPGSALCEQITVELDDLLCRLFHTSQSIIVRPLVAGNSGVRVLRIRPFFTNGAGHEVVVKYGDAGRVEKEFLNYKHYVQPFLGSGRYTAIHDKRRTHHLGGIIYSLLGTTGDQVEDFGSFYQHASIAQVKDALDRLFHDSCGSWYANPGHLESLDLTESYQSSLGYTPDRIEQVREQRLPGVKGRYHLQFDALGAGRRYINPILAAQGKEQPFPTYIGITHGDFNQHNLLVDKSGNVWMIDFQETGPGHILRDVATLDAVVRFQLLQAEQATLEDRLLLEQALNSVDSFSQFEQPPAFTSPKSALVKTHAIVWHLRNWARRFVDSNPEAEIEEYYVALMYTAMNTLSFTTLSMVQLEHALLSASLLAERLHLDE